MVAKHQLPPCQGTKGCEESHGIGKGQVGGEDEKVSLQAGRCLARESVVGLCKESLVWEQGTKQLDTILPCLAVVMLNTASCRSLPALQGVQAFKRPTSCLYGRGNLVSLVLKAPGSISALVAPSFLL